MVFGLKHVSDLAVSVLLKPVFELGLEIWDIKAFVKLYGNHETRLGSFCEALDKEVHEWQASIFEVEVRIIACIGSVSILETCAQIVDKLINVRWITVLLKSYETLDYAHLFNQVYQICDNARLMDDVSIVKLSNKLLIGILLEYFEELESWLTSGILQESSTFMVESNDKDCVLKNAILIPLIFHGWSDRVLSLGIHARMCEQLYIPIKPLYLYQILKLALLDTKTYAPLSIIIGEVLESIIGEHSVKIESQLFTHISVSKELNFSRSFAQIKGFFLAQERCVIDSFMTYLFIKV